MFVLTSSLPLMTRETVWCDTPARSATSRMVGCLDMRSCSTPLEVACSCYELHGTAHTSIMTRQSGRTLRTWRTLTPPSAVLSLANVIGHCDRYQDPKPGSFERQE